MVYLTRQEHFNAAHKLANPAWSKEKNEAVLANVQTRTGMAITMIFL